MPDWTDLPEDVRQRILLHAVMQPFQEGHVPSMQQLARQSAVSRAFSDDTRRALQGEYQDTVGIMGGTIENALNVLVEQTTTTSPSAKKCSIALRRLYFTSVLDAGETGPKAKELVRQLSDRLAQKPGLDGPDRGMLQVIVEVFQMYAQMYREVEIPIDAREKPDHGPPGIDTAGLQSMILSIQQNYPKTQYLCVALGASADPIAVGLRMAGYDVRYLSLSGVDSSNAFRMRNIDYVKLQVATWPATPRQVLLLDAVSSGTALRVMSEMITVAHRLLSLAPRPVTLLGLNQPGPNTATDPGAPIQYLAPTVGPGAQQRIEKQDFKEGLVGRLYPKSEGGPPAGVPLSDAALQRMVVAMLGPYLRT